MIAFLASRDGGSVPSESSPSAHAWAFRLRKGGSDGVLVRKVRKLAVMDRDTEHPSNGWTFRTAGVVTHFFSLTNPQGGEP